MGEKNTRVIKGMGGRGIYYKGGSNKRGQRSKTGEEKGGKRLLCKV